MIEFWQELGRLIENITGWSTAMNRTKAENNTIGIIDVPTPLGQANLSKTRERAITFQLSFKGDSMAEVIEKAELVYKELDFHRTLSGDNWVAEIMPYTSPQFAFRDENGRTVYTVMFNAIKIDKGEI